MILLKISHIIDVAERLPNGFQELKNQMLGQRHRPKFFASRYTSEGLTD